MNSSSGKKLKNTNQGLQQIPQTTLTAGQSWLRQLISEVSAPPKDLRRVDYELFKAVQNHDIRSVQGALARGANIDVEDDQGVTALHYAVCNKDPRELRYILKDKHLYKYQMIIQEMPDDPMMVCYLIDLKANPNIPRHFETPLYWAVRLNLTNIALTLLAQPIEKLSFGEFSFKEVPFLFYAIENKNSNIARALINKNFKMFCKFPMIKYVMTYLLFAMHNDLEDVAIDLLENQLKYIKYPLDYKYCKIQEAISLANDKGYNHLKELLFRDQYEMNKLINRTAIVGKHLPSTKNWDLTEAVSGGDINKVANLIKGKRLDTDSYCLLNNAVIYARFEIIKLMIDSGFPVDGIIEGNQYEAAALMDIKNTLEKPHLSNFFITTELSQPLHTAILSGNYDIALYLIERGANLSRVIYNIEALLQFKKSTQALDHAANIISLFNFSQKNPTQIKQFIQGHIEFFLSNYELIEQIRSPKQPLVLGPYIPYSFEGREKCPFTPLYKGDLSLSIKKTLDELYSIYLAVNPQLDEAQDHTDGEDRSRAHFEAQGHTGHALSAAASSQDYLPSAMDDIAMTGISAPDAVFDID